MARKQPPKSAVAYAQRLFEDEYIQDQIRDTAGGIRSAYDRISRKPERAAEDKKVYSSVRRAATSIRKAFLALRRPEPEPEPKHRLRTALVALAVVGGSVMVVSTRKSAGREAGASNPVVTDGFRSDVASEETAASSQPAPSTPGE
jgi:hypothetical protein